MKPEKKGFLTASCSEDCMSIFNFFRRLRGSPPRSPRSGSRSCWRMSGRAARPDFLPILQRELLAVIAKYVPIDEKKVEVSFDARRRFSTLEVNIELPPPSPEKTVRARGAGTGDAAATAKRA